MIATKVREVECKRPDVSHVLWRLQPPLDGNEYVITSATDVMFSGPETYIFGCDESGKIERWGELEGSFKGGMEHDQAIRNAGYTVSN